MSEETPRLSSIVLRVSDSSRESLKWFYTKVMGMHHVVSRNSEEGIDAFVISQRHPQFPEFLRKHDSADLKFLSKPSLQPYQPSRDDVYWKIGLVLNDVDVAVDTINKAMESLKYGSNDYAPIQHGCQFLDIGFLTPLKDPCNFSIELLQTSFKDNVELRKQLIENVLKEEDEFISNIKGKEPSNDTEDNLVQSKTLLESEPFVIGQVTTRITDPQKSIDFYTNVMKMKLLSIQEVTKYRFTLYFLGYTKEVPPEKEDLKHVRNREWLWQRKYTTLELQWRWDSKYLTKLKDNFEGLDSLEVEIAHKDKTHASSLLQNIKNEKSFCLVTKEMRNVSFDGYSTQLHGIITDPDGLKIKLISKSYDQET
jgi:catechol 2,3-dioxygenase-like lactoylglutathione lyase family enzyme